MLAEVIDQIHTDHSPDLVPAVVVQRRAFYLPARGGDSTFAWLHTRRHEPSCDHGVVICPPIGFEQLHAHRGLRHLADEICRFGFPTLRFDWNGTGDSSGSDCDSGRLAAWQSDVQTAVRWLKQQLGCRNISIVGLRMGATIASLSLAEEVVENLVLWAPVTNGRMYVREMTVIDMTSETRHPSAIASEGAIEAAGFLLNPGTQAELTACSLLQSHPRCDRILLASRDDAPLDQRLVDRLDSLGIPTDQRTLTGLAEMLVEPHRGTVPTGAIRDIACWIRDHSTITGTIATDGLLDRSAASITLPASLPGNPADADPIQEQIVSISDSPNLFGILSRPASVPVDDRPLIVLLNAGAAYRAGPGRMNVELARHFALAGFRCLRIDACGLGDSVPASVEDENDSYAGTIFRDIEITTRYAREHLGARRCILMGLCSGAYAAFQSAVQSADPSIVESILINPLTFFWCDGMTLETAPSRQMIRQHYYLASALQPAKWLKLLSGKSRIGLVGAMKLLWQRFGRKSLFRRSHRKNCATPSGVSHAHPQTQDLPADLKRIVKNGRKLSLIFATGDPGYSILLRQARRRTQSMLRSAQLDLTFIDDADHTFSRQRPRQQLIDHLVNHLTRRYSDKNHGVRSR